MSNEADHKRNGKRRREESSTTSTTPTAIPVPVSLGKPSLRRRLEDYYSLIAPDVIANEIEWRRKFELIYDKYGASAEKELSLARKLAKKYGNTVRLRLTTTNEQIKEAPIQNMGVRRSEDWYEISVSQRNSGIVDFTSSSFDPMVTLSAATSKVYNVNPFATNAPLLDNLDKFRGYLPLCDPLRKILIPKRITPTSTSNSSTHESTKTESMKKKIPVFTAMAAQYENSGPLSVLHSIHVQRQRVRVMVRYVDCIRGTLTGYVLAFDKHMNMILRDVDEVYTSRVTKIFEGMELSKSELEQKRRICVEEFEACGGKGTKTSSDAESRVKVGKRHLHQILVRGDNVVSLWRADDERCSLLNRGNGTWNK